ncbi:MAG: FeoB-associated Cys-rich membrane protein [Lachnospirales bacterium]
MLANIIVSIIVFALIVWSVITFIKQRKNGGCGCNCSGCINRCKDKK